MAYRRGEKRGRDGVREERKNGRDRDGERMEGKIWKEKKQKKES